MGNDNSGGGGGGSSTQCTGAGAPGLNEMCYQAGAAQTQGTANPDIVGEALVAGVCATNANANACYGQGASDNTYISEYVGHH
jgi:hypothetical protein